jgi:hypothetical protein
MVLSAVSERGLRADFAVCAGAAVIAWCGLWLARESNQSAAAMRGSPGLLAGMSETGPSNPVACADGARTGREGPRGTTDAVPRYYIGIAVSRPRGAPFDPGLLPGARSFLARQVGRLEDVVVAPERETAGEAPHVLRERSLSGFYLDATISGVERQPNGALRARVSILVATYPDREMRAIMRGTATATNGAAAGAERAAIEGALTSALRQLRRALAR